MDAIEHGQLEGLSRPLKAPSEPRGNAPAFGQTLEQALNRLDSMSVEAEALSSRFARGEPVDLHRVLATAEQARLALSLAAEVRNKVYESYQELTRMGI